METMTTKTIEKQSGCTRVLKIQGYDACLYGLIGPFVMNPLVLRENDWYPFRNTEDHTWYIAVRGRNLVTGFLSVCDGHIANDFTWHDQNTLAALLEEALADVAGAGTLAFMAEEAELPVLEKLGFCGCGRRGKYYRMVRCTDEQRDRIANG
jgi:hypothetical protein